MRDPNDGPRPRGPGAAAPLFLARNRYRARRLRDVARLMPVLAALVWLFPLLWRGDLPGMGGTARSAVFLFAGWAVLIVGTVLLSRRIELSDPAEATPTDPPA
ncbi:hypothetical protein EU805_08950 [Salipiger sp. IMCC34102]|nr:hypothetical protein EU805_08950 [Salipiger sp. IMCC34102]